MNISVPKIPNHVGILTLPLSEVLQLTISFFSLGTKHTRALHVFIVLRPPNILQIIVRESMDTSLMCRRILNQLKYITMTFD